MAVMAQSGCKRHILFKPINQNVAKCHKFHNQGHCVDGISQIKTYPILAGQHKNYLVHSLKGYRSGERKNIIMKGFAENLSDQDIEDLSVYFSMQKGLTIPPLK